MKALSKITSLALLSLTFTHAHSETIESGFYGLANFGTSKVEGTVVQTGYANGKGENNTNGWQIGLGYDINKYFATEVAYAQIYKSNNTWTSGSYINNNSTSAVGLVLNGLAKYEVYDGVKIFGGPSVATAKLKQSSTYVYGTSTSYESSSKSTTPFGYIIGASMALDPRTDLRISYSTYNKYTWSHAAGTGTSAQGAYKETTKFSTILLGLSVKF